jgi:hypothetical protein
VICIQYTTQTKISKFAGAAIPNVVNAQTAEMAIQLEEMKNDENRY